jgi:hypothetical protein
MLGLGRPDARPRSGRPRGPSSSTSFHRSPSLSSLFFSLAHPLSLSILSVLTRTFSILCTAAVTCASVVSGRARMPEDRRYRAPVTHPCSPAGHGEGDCWELPASGRRVGDGGDEETRRVVGFWWMLQACVSCGSDVSSGCCKCFAWMLQK